MDSYGLIIKNAREEKNLTLEQVAAETLIKKQYLEAIEEENDSEFPTEAYFLGFVRNYCKYLDVDGDNIVHLYTAKKIQEAPPPVELLAKKKSVWVIATIITAVTLFVVGIVCFLIFFVFKVPQKIKQSKEALVEQKKIHQYTFTGKSETKRLYKGDQIFIPASDGTGKIILTVESTLEKFKIQTPSGTQIIELSEERDFDIDGDLKSDIIFYVSDISNKNEDFGAEVRIIGKNSSAEEEIAKESEVVEDEQIPLVQNLITMKDSITVIHEDYRAYPFTIRAIFRSPCLFRYKIDFQDPIEEYFRTGETLTINANNGFRLWMSNANAVKLQVIAANKTYDLDVSKAGLVKVEDIKWIRDPDKKYKLVVSEID